MNIEYDSKSPLGASLGMLGAQQELKAHAKRKPDKLLTCDEVAWVKHVLTRFEGIVRQNHPGISRAVEAAKIAAILELAELMNVGFADDAAKHNVISAFPELYQGSRAQ